jgi:predicted DNA-binding transcriptional regulator YafY
MSKATYISRFAIILKKLKANPYSSYEDLKKWIDKESEYIQLSDERLTISFSKRTLQRDLKEIRTLFGIEIIYSKSQGGYYIEETEGENQNFQRMIESYDVFNSLNLAQDASRYIQLEKRKPQGTENLYGLLHAIKNNQQIKFNYHKFWDEESSDRKVNPYALKEFKSRWYLIGQDQKNLEIRTFALDRLSQLEILKQKFKEDKSFDINEMFRFSFGIISPTDDDPVQLILSFNQHQGKYIKTLPLHESQEIIIDSKKELRIKLTAYFTHDLLMEILSFGENVKIIEPAWVVKEVKSEISKALKKYS